MADVRGPLCEPAALQCAFKGLSAAAAQEAPELGINVPHVIRREDVLTCLEVAAGRALCLAELAALHRCFALDISALIGWQEFQESLRRTQEKLEEGPSQHPMFRSRRRLLAARRQGLVPPPDAACPQVLPLTSSQEVGWHLSSAAPCAGGVLLPVQRITRGGDTLDTYAPRKGTDVTRGGEGRSLQSYYGAQLGRCF